MKKLLKGLSLGIFILLLVVGVGVGIANASLTLGALTVTSSGTLDLEGDAASAITMGALNTGGIAIGNGATIKTISIGAGNAVNTIKIGDHATPVNVITIGGAASTLGFYGVTPVVRPSAYTQTYSTADKTHAALTATTISAAVAGAAPAGGVGTAAGGWDTEINRDAAIATINALRVEMAEVRLDYEALLVDLTDLKQLVNALIDDQQALGLIQ